MNNFNLFLKAIPTLASAGKALINVSKISIKLLALFINRKSLPILNALITEVELPIFPTIPPFSKITLNIVSTTIIKSKLFQEF